MHRIIIRYFITKIKHKLMDSDNITYHFNISSSTAWLAEIILPHLYQRRMLRNYNEVLYQLILAVKTSLVDKD